MQVHVVAHVLRCTTGVIFAVVTFTSSRGQEPSGLVRELKGTISTSTTRGNSLYVDLADTACSDTDLAAICMLSGVSGMDISSSHVTPNGFKELSNLDGLAELSLSRLSLRDDDIKYLPRLNKVEILDLSHNTLSGTGMRGLKGKVPCLTHLTLSGNPLTTDGLRSVVEAAPSLQTLVVDDCRLTAADLDVIAQLTQIEKLSLRATQITDDAVKALSALQRLDELNLADNELSDRAVSYFADRRMRSLIALDTHIRGDGVDRLIGLQTLHIGGEGVSDYTLKVAARCRDLRVLYLFSS